MVAAWYWGPYLRDKMAMLDEVLLSQLPHQSLIYLDGDGEGNRAKATEVLASVWSRLQHAHKRGRSPLIVVGAGVSRPAPARVPLMDDLLGHIIGLARSENADDEVVKLCAQANKTRNRSDVAILFGALQNSRTDITRPIWKRFCDDFLSWKIETTTASYSLPQTPWPEPTEAHRWIAEMCASYGARCLSVNFDGLTRRALDLHLEDARMCGKTVILDAAAKIENFFGRAPMRDNCKPLYAVFKVRGDVFYARCKTSGCPLECAETPVYDLHSYIRSDDEVKPNDVSVLACSECGEPRNLQIGFPGHHEKEVESAQILASLWRFVVPSTSMIILLGFSGEWDHATVDFVFEAGRSQGIPVLDIRLEPANGAKHYIHDVWSTEYANVTYKGLYGTANRFAELMRANGTWR